MEVITWLSSVVVCLVDWTAGNDWLNVLVSSIGKDDNASSAMMVGIDTVPWSVDWQLTEMKENNRIQAARSQISFRFSRIAVPFFTQDILFRGYCHPQTGVFVEGVFNENRLPTD